MIKPPSQTLPSWLKANLGKSCLAGNTGTDQKALLAAIQIIDLYSYDRDPSLLVAFSLIVNRMQTKQQFLAFHAIAHVMDWSDRHTIWEIAGLPVNSTWTHCQFEPKGRP